MRLAMAQPCFGSSAIVLRIRRSRVPWTRSLGFPICYTLTIYNTEVIVDSQGVWDCPVGEYLRRIRIEFPCRMMIQSDSDSRLVEIALAPGFQTSATSAAPSNVQSYR